MIEIKSPNPINPQLESPTVFLAGSIEEGKAEPWQDKVKNALAGLNVTLYNPRRDAWDASWKQTIDNPQFKEQVEWELSSIEAADLVFIYIDPKTMSPITLLEFGTLWKSNKIIIGCPKGFWRRGNLEVMCNLVGLRLHETLEETIETLKLRLLQR